MRHDQDLAALLYDLYDPLLSCTQGGHQHKHEDDVVSPESLIILHSLLLLAQEDKPNCHVQGWPRL